MTVTYDRDDVKRRVIVTLAGPFDLAATLAIVAYLAADDSWSYGILYDTHDLTGTPTMTELQMIVDRVQSMSAQRPRGPVAVVTSDPTVYDMAQVYATRLEGKVSVAVFRSLDEAGQWLDGQRLAGPGAPM